MSCCTWRNGALAGIRVARAMLGLMALALCLFGGIPAAAAQEGAAEAPAVEPVTRQPWQEVVVSVGDLDMAARFLLEVGQYETHWRGPLDASLIAAWELPPAARGEALLLGAKGYNHGLIRLVRFDQAGAPQPIRPGARAWDTGCFFSIMTRMKNLPELHRRAIALGWRTETPIVRLTVFGSDLRIVNFLGPFGLTIGAYERIAPPLPAEYPPFYTISGPFNIMQTVRDRDASHDFYAQVLGFVSRYKGDPFLADEPTPTPLGLPLGLTTTQPYRAGILYPVPAERGRVEMVDFPGLQGHDHAERCNAPNYGILALRFPVEDIERASALISSRGWPINGTARAALLPPYGRVDMLRIKTPDGANLHFYAPASNPAP